MNSNRAAENLSSDGEVPLPQAAFVHSLKKVKKPLPARPKISEIRAISKNSRLFLKKYFPGATTQDWNNWKWQVRNSFHSFEDLSKIINLTDPEKNAIRDHGYHLPLRVTPYYASLLADNHENNVIRKSMIPTMSELTLSPGEAEDPLGEESTSPVPCLVHRYPDRVLFLATNFCSAYCRYCTRSHMVAKDPQHYDLAHWNQAFDYLSGHPEIRDVIISGGDPLTINEIHLEYLISRLRSIPHLEIIRLGTKVPIVLPQRITRSLVQMLKKYQPIYFSIHFMHPSELTPETVEACNRLADGGFPLGSQTVLLKGINDNVPVMKDLMHGLLKMRVRPYYIYQCDPIPGSAHFRTSVRKGLDIIRGLRGFTSGYAVPHYVIDAPGGGGKIPLLPDYVVGKEGNYLILKNYQGRIFKYPDMDDES